VPVSGLKKRFSVADGAIALVLLLISFVCVAPILHTISVSFSASEAATGGRVGLWPIGVNLDAYRFLVDDQAFLKAFGVSVKRVLLGVTINMAVTILMAYPLSRYTNQFRTRNLYMWLVVFTMLFNAGLIPWYMTIKSFGLIDSIWALVLPTAVPAFNVILLMNFFRGIPKELDEAGAVDGAGSWYMLFRVYVPLSMPAIATVGLFAIVSHWNSFFDGLVLINTADKQPLQTYINQAVVQIQLTNITSDQVQNMAILSNQTVNAAKILLSMLPILVIYPFLQRYFVHGITLGSVKE